MSGIFIKSITAKGPGLKDSTISFKHGVNIIHGASNTGKSMVHACIDYILGSSEVPFHIKVTGYDEVVGTICDSVGGELTVARKILDGEEGSKPCTQINVTSTNIDGIETGVYSANHRTKKPYDRILLKLLGIDEEVMLVASTKWKLNQLTFRTFINLFYLSKETIDKSGSIVVEDRAGITKSICALIYLLTGATFERPTDADLETKKIRRKAVLDYIARIRKQLDEEKAALEESIIPLQESNIDSDINELEKYLMKLQDELTEKEIVARGLSSKIAALDIEVNKNSYLFSKFNDLKTQYDADILRLEFIVEGDEIADRKVSECPFCNNVIEDLQTVKKYTEASEIELASLKNRRRDLELEAKDLKNDLENQNTELKNLTRERQVIFDEINEQYKPTITQLRERISHIKELSKLEGEIEVKQQILETLDIDAKEEIESSKEDKLFKVRDHFDDTLFEALSDSVSRAVKRCNYHNFKSAHLSKQTFDLIVNDKPKSSEGSGYTTFLNSLYAFTLMKFIEANGKHPSRLLLLDSPMLALTEPKKYELPDTMLHGLLTYFIEECGDSQIIISENKIPESVDLSNVHMINFTATEDEGQYGFLESFRN